MPKKLEQDAKDRAVRLVEDCILAKNKSIQEACKVVTPNLGVSWHTVRRWAQAARREGRVSSVEAGIRGSKQSASPGQVWRSLHLRRSYSQGRLV